MDELIRPVYSRSMTGAAHHGGRGTAEVSQVLFLTIAPERPRVNGIVRLSRRLDDSM